MTSNSAWHIGKTPFTLAHTPHDKKSPGGTNMREKAAGDRAKDVPVSSR